VLLLTCIYVPHTLVHTPVYGIASCDYDMLREWMKLIMTRPVGIYVRFGADTNNHPMCYY